VIGNVTPAAGTFTALSATGNVTGAYIFGNGSGLSSITGANVTGTVANATYAISAGSATTAGTVTNAAQPNITSLGNLASLVLPVASSDPSTSTIGQAYFNTFVSRIRVFTSSGWVSV
jgi:hypothetical protein